MATEVLYPYDVLGIGDAFLPRRKHHGFSNPNPNPNPNPRAQWKPQPRKRREGPPKNEGSGNGRRQQQQQQGKKQQIQVGEGRREERVGLPTDVYAGSAFSNSPSPRALPLPNFSRREDGGGGAVVDLSATMNLRRLLRLD